MREQEATREEQRLRHKGIEAGAEPAHAHGDAADVLIGSRVRSRSRWLSPKIHGNSTLPKTLSHARPACSQRITRKMSNAVVHNEARSQAATSREICDGTPRPDGRQQHAPQLGRERMLLP